MMSRGFITAAEVIGPSAEDAKHVDLRVTDNEELPDETLFIVEIEIGDGGDTILLNESNAAALTEALGEILRRYRYVFRLAKQADADA